MSEEQDPRLQALFAEANESLDDTEFTKRVVKQTQKRKVQWYLAGALALIVVLAIASQFILPLQSVAMVLTQVLSIELVNLGENTVSWFLTPINNLATLLVVLGKGLRMSWNKVRQASYAN